MKGEFSKSTFTKRMRYDGVTTQQGRVELDEDWSERLDLQVHAGLIYLQIWEREVRPLEDDSLDNVAVEGPESGSRQKDSAAEKCVLRLTRDVTKARGVSSTLLLALGRGDSRGSFVLPELEINVNGLPWTRVASFSGTCPTDRVYIVRKEGDRSTIEFGDGENGARPAANSRVIAGYRFGEGGNRPGFRWNRKSKRPPRM